MDKDSDSASNSEPPPAKWTEAELKESFGSFGMPGEYDYSDEDLDEKAEEIFMLAPGEAPPIKEYDYGELSLENADDFLDEYSYDAEVEGLD